MENQPWQTTSCKYMNTFTLPDGSTISLKHLITTSPLYMSDGGYPYVMLTFQQIPERVQLHLCGVGLEDTRRSWDQRKKVGQETLKSLIEAWNACL
jgi:hypothetical protein